MSTDSDAVARQCREFREMFEALRAEVGKVIVGHTEIVEGVLVSLFCGGHVLLEGVPGLGKTLLVRTLSSALSLEFQRIQFTPDLMPADIIGTNIVMEEASTGKRVFEFQPGPIFAQMILADEINRATPKTQSAMLEAMQEHSVSSGGRTIPVPEPFMVLATQNPIEQEGTYPLPEAQLDRFFFKLLVSYSDADQLREILERTTTGRAPAAEPIIGADRILQAQQLVRRVAVAPHVQDYAIQLVQASHPGSDAAVEMTERFVRFGASPRGLQAIVLGAKVRALLAERYHVSFEDVAASLVPAMRHRLILNFEGQAEGLTTDDVLEQVLQRTPTAEAKTVRTP